MFKFQQKLKTAKCIFDELKQCLWTYWSLSFFTCMHLVKS